MLLQHSETNQVWESYESSPVYLQLRDAVLRITEDNLELKFLVPPFLAQCFAHYLLTVGVG